MEAYMPEDVPDKKTVQDIADEFRRLYDRLRKEHPARTVQEGLDDFVRDLDQLKSGQS
jgi:hypothetical protein